MRVTFRVGPNLRLASGRWGLLGQMQSFFLGVVIATVMLGGLLLAYNAVSGDDSPGSGNAAQSQPTSVPTSLVVLAQSTATRTPVPGSVTPTVTPSPTAAGSTTPTPTGTIVSDMPQPNRANCVLIRGTDYQSDAEQAFFTANCLNPPTPVPTSVTGSANAGGSNIGLSGGGQAVAPGPALPPPTPTLPPRDPRQVLFENLIASTITEAEAVVARLAAPSAVESQWRNEVSTHIGEVQRLVGVASVTPPPNCLIVPYQTVRSAGIELSIGAGLASSGVDANDLNLMRLAQQRIATGRAGLMSALTVVTNADC